LLPRERLVIYKNGDFAKGYFNPETNEREGRVIYYNTKGFKLEADFHENKRQGKASLKLHNSEFVGNYTDDSKNGFGHYKSEIEHYIGEFKNGYYEGYGRYIDQDGWNYEG
jgi:hypothetical protein